MNANNNVKDVSSVDLKSITGFPTTCANPLYEVLTTMFPYVPIHATPREVRDALKGCDELTLDFLLRHTGRDERRGFVDRMLQELGIIDYYPNTMANIIRTAVRSFNYDWEIFLPVLTYYFKLSRIELTAGFRSKLFYEPEVFMMFDYFCYLLNEGVAGEGVRIPAAKTICDLVKSSPALYWSSDEFHRMQVKLLRTFMLCNDPKALLEMVEQVSRVARRIEGAGDYRYTDLLEWCLRNFEDVCLSKDHVLRGVAFDKECSMEVLKVAVRRLKRRRDLDVVAFDAFRRWVYPYGSSMLAQRFSLDDISQTFTPVKTRFGSIYDYELTLQMNSDSGIPGDELDGWRSRMLSNGLRFKTSCPIWNQKVPRLSTAIYVPTTSTDDEGCYTSKLGGVTLPSHHARIKMFVLNGGRDIPDMTYLTPNAEISDAMNP